MHQGTFNNIGQDWNASDFSSPSAFFFRMFVLHFGWRPAMNDCRDTLFFLPLANRRLLNSCKLYREHSTNAARMFEFINGVFIIWSCSHSWNTKTISLLRLRFNWFDTQTHKRNENTVNEPPIYLSNAQFYQNIHVKWVWMYLSE